MSKTAKKTIIVFILIALLIAACSSQPTDEIPSEAPPVATTTEQIVKTETEEIKPSSTPTEIPPTETPTKPPTAVSQEVLTEKWQPAISFYAFTYSACQATLDTAEASASGESSGSESLGGLLTAGLILTSVDEGLPEWEPALEMEEHKDNLQIYVDDLSDITSRWTNDDISSSQAADELAEICPSIEEDTLSLVEVAKDDGLTQESIEKIGQDMQDAFMQLEPEEEKSSLDDLSTEIGLSRSNPYPYGEMGSAPNWDIQILDVVQGEEAWEMLKAASSINDPPRENMEYILIMVKAISTSTGNEEQSISYWDFKLTGSNLIEYDSAYVFSPSPELDATVFPGGEAEGWIVFEVGMEENNLILIVDEAANWEEDRFRFFAAEEGAAIEFPKEVSAIQPTDIGKERNAPAGYGEKVITEDWEVTVTEVIRGDEAWSMIEEASSFNDPPEDGMEYILVKWQVRYIGISNLAEEVDNYSFKSTGSNNVLYDYPSVVLPEPVLDPSLFPGGEYEGWVALQVSKGETNVLAVFQPWADWDEINRRYLSLEEK